MADFPSAVFRQGPFTVDVDGYPYTFPALSAAEWLDILAAPGWSVRVFGLCDDDAYQAFTDRAERGDATKEQLQRIVYGAVEAAGGRNWWEVTRLAGVCLAQPTVTGSVLMRGVDPTRCTLAAFLAVVWTMIMQSGSDLERTQREMELIAPPPEALDTAEPEALDMDELVARMRAAPGVSTR